MKADRLLALLLELQGRGKASATVLARRLEVSVRTIYRDVDALSAAGVPIAAERGSLGGIVLADRYRDALARFGDDELRAIFVSRDDSLAEIGLLDGRRSALDKLARAMPERAREVLRRTRGRVHVDARRWLPSAPVAAPLTQLREAVWDDRCVSIAYSDRAGKVTRRSVEPLGLVTKAGVWYLVARDRETVKSFRVQRIARVRVLERRFARPAGFDVGDYWQSVAAHVAVEERPFVATFRVTRRALANLTTYLTIQSRTRVRGSRPPSWIARVVFPSFAQAVHEAAAWTDELVAIEPPELLGALEERGRALSARYGPRCDEAGGT